MAKKKKPTPGVWGIDLGQCSLKALRIEERDGQLVATAFDYVEHPKILSQHDADPDQLTREALEKFLSRNQLRGDVVAVSVPGQSGLARFVKLPPVEEKKINDIVKFEAKQQIPFSLDEVVWDYQKLSSGVVTGGFAMETEIGLFAMKRDAINHSLQQFKEVGIDVNVIQMAPLSLCNYLAFDVLKKDPTPTKEKEGEGEAPAAPPPGAKRKCVVALDIGTDSSNLVITDGEKVIWQRPIPLGGTNFTRALVKDLKLTYAKAEHLKRNATKSPDLKKILAALKPVLNDFVGEVQRSLSFFTSTHRDAEIEQVLGLGNAFRLPGLQRYMSEKLKLDVKKLDEMQRVTGDEVLKAPAFKENVMTFGVCYGLALQGLARARLITNLLPEEIRFERMVKAKKPWVAAAVASLLLGLGAMAYGTGKHWIAYADARYAKSHQQGDAAVAQCKSAERAFDDDVSSAKKEMRDVQSMVTNDEEQLNWIRLSKFIGEVIPKPEDCETAQFRARRLNQLKNQGESLKDEQIMEYVESKEWRGKLPLPAKDYIFQAIRSLEIKEGDYRLKKEEYERRRRDRARTATEAAEDTPEAKAVREEHEKLERHVTKRVGLEDLMEFHVEGWDARYTDDLSAYWQNLYQANNLAVKSDRVRPTSDGAAKVDNVAELVNLASTPKGKGWVVELRGYTYYNGNSDAGIFILDVLGARIAEAGQRTPIPLLGGGSVVASGAVSAIGWHLPAPSSKENKEQTDGAATGGNQFSSGAPNSFSGGDEAAKKVEKDVRPISHVVLFATHETETTNKREFTLINKSIVDQVVTGQAGGERGDGPAGGFGGPGKSPGMNEPDGGSGGSTSTSDSGTALGQDKPKANRSGWPGSRSARTTGSSGLTGSGPQAQKEKDAPRRTEFVLLFVWREPAPVDTSFVLKQGTGIGGPGYGGGGFPGASTSDTGTGGFPGAPMIGGIGK